jgi:hypothetical protein
VRGDHPGVAQRGDLATLHPELTEDSMTDDRIAFVELLQKSGEGDFLRAVAEAVLQILTDGSRCRGTDRCRPSRAQH